MPQLCFAGSSKRFALILFILLLPVVLLAQKKKGQVSGTVLDAIDQEPIVHATVTVYNAADTSLATYTLTGENGGFTARGLSLQVNYRLVITATGYTVFRKTFRFKEEGEILDLEKIQLQPDTSTLEEVIVTAERPPIVVRKDTIEFNAAAFKTLPGDQLKSLMRKLPGVEFSEDGSMLINGRKVNRILIEGKEFFNNQQNIALNNLPADLIKRIQVTDDQEQLLEDPEVNKADLGQIVNVKLKSGINSGLFGRLYAGKDMEDKHEAGGMINYFRDTLQASFIGYSNNVNKAGFSMEDMKSVSGGQSINTSASSMGGASQGLQLSRGGGINLNNYWGSRLKANLVYFYGNTQNDQQQFSQSSQLIGDTAQNTTSSYNNFSNNKYHKISSSLDWKLDTLTRIQFRPGINLSQSAAHFENTSATLNNFDEKLNNSNRSGSNESHNNNYSHTLTFDHRFKNAQRRITLTHSLHANNNHQDAYTNSFSELYKTANEYDSVTVNQLRQTPNKQLNTNTTLRFTTPLAENIQLSVDNNYNSIHEERSTNSYSLNEQTGKYDMYVDSISNTFKRNGLKNYLSPSIVFSFPEKKISIKTGAKISWINLDNDFSNASAVRQRYFYVLPDFNFGWKSFRISYNAQVGEPNAQDMQTIPDNTNPLYQSIGNPDLKPSVRHSLFFNMFTFDPKNMSHLSIYAGGSLMQNAVVRERTVDSRGVQTSRPVNINGNTNLYGNVQGGFGLREIGKWRLMINPNIAFNYGKNKLLLNDATTTYATWSAGPGLNVGFYWKNLIDINPGYSLSFQQTNRANSTGASNQTLRHTFRTNLTLRPIHRLIFEASYTYTYNSQAAAGIRKSINRLNMELSMLLFKQNQGHIKLSVNDLFNQNISVWRYAYENAINETTTNTLQRYVMLTFQYDIRRFGKGGKR